MGRIIDLCKILLCENKKFLYNGFNNSMIEVDDDSLGLLNDSNSPYFEPHSLSVCYTKDTDEIRWKSQYMLRHAIIGLTENCNMRCKYCGYHDMRYQANRPLRDMNLETLNKTLDFIIEHSSYSSETAVSFYGGEALLHFDLVIYAVNYMEKKNYIGRKFSFFVSTNGLLLNSDVIDYFVDKNIRCVVSFDGPSFLHDRYRVDINGNSTYSTIIRNIKRIAKRYPEYYKNNLSFNSVISPPYDYHIPHDFFKTSKVSFIDVTIGEYFGSYLSDHYGVKHFEEERDSRCNTTRKPTDVSNIQSGSEYLGYLKKFMGLVEEVKPKSIFPSGFCVPLERRIHVNIDGKIILCERVDEYNPRFQMGNVYDGYDYDKINLLYEYTSNILRNNCDKCWAFRFCSACFSYLSKIELYGEYCTNMRKSIEKDFSNYLQFKYSNNRFDEIMQAISID